MVLKEGLEPSRSREQQILSLPRLPFRHSSIDRTSGQQGLKKFNTSIIMVANKRVSSLYTCLLLFHYTYSKY